VQLVDPRALATVRHVASGDVDAVLPELGLEATDPALDAEVLRTALRGRRAPIKVALLDQRVLAGLGNIYAAEALWRARIDPRVPAGALGARRLHRLADAIRETMADAMRAPGRYRDEAGVSLQVYDREGAPCPRCGAAVRRIVQAGRSTYFCPSCQRA
jgi:formamidopyrimidine-DNA glycosylase